MSENNHSLFKQSAWFRLLCYYPLGYLFSFFFIAFLYEIPGWKWLEFAYPAYPSDYFNRGLALFAVLFTILWVWRKPIFRPVIRVLKRIDKSAD